MTTISRRSFVGSAALGTAALGAGMAASSALAEQAAGPAGAAEAAWDYEADVVVLGAGGSGLVAALKALDEGASVILVESNFEVGGHSAVSEGNLHMGAGTDVQASFGIEDTPDRYYLDHTYGHLVVSRLDDRKFNRVIANHMVEVYDYIQQKGVKVQDKEPVLGYGGTVPTDLGMANEGYGDTVPTMSYTDGASGEWESYRGKSEAGIALTRPLERSAREGGAQFLMNYHMDRIIREEQGGRVLGVMATHTPHVLPGQTEPLGHLMTQGDIECDAETVYVKANRGVIVCTGGSTGNLTLRTAYDPRLGPEYDGLAGMPFSDQDGSGEIAAMEVGAALGCMSNYMQEGGYQLCTVSRVGCRYGYGSGFAETSPVWPLVGANGVSADWGSMVFVNMLGKRFGNDDEGALARGGEGPAPYLDAALSSVVIDGEADDDAVRYGGPIWAIFDQDECDRKDWNLVQGVVDYEGGYCFRADTLEELAEKVINKYYEDVKMDPATLVETIANWNACVEAGEDPEFGVKDNLVNKVEHGPFYAAWATPNLHDCYGGLRVNGEMQVYDIHGELIGGLYAAGESCAGSRRHGHGRVMISGYLAGQTAARGGSQSTESVEEDYYGTYRPEVQPTLGDEELGAGSPDGDAAASGELADGTYTGSTESGQNGTVTVEVVVERGAIASIEVIEQNETAEIGGAALPTLVEQALDAQSAEIEGVSGATVTSGAFKAALVTALAKAQA